MIGISNFSRILICSAFAGTNSFAATGTLVLGNAEGENVIRIDLGYAGIFRDEQPTTYSGTIKVELDIDTDADEVVSFEMTGGKISTTDMDFLFDAGFFGSQTIRLRNAKATPMSPEGAEILASPGVFDATKHVFEFNEGRSETSGSFGEGNADIAEGPFLANGRTTGSIDLSGKREILSALDGKLIAYEYDMAFSVNLDSSSTSDLDGQEVTIDTEGVVTAAGVVRVAVNDFYEWAFQNAPVAGLSLAFNADANADGVADGVSWALGFPPAEMHGEILRMNAGDGRVEVLVSPSGTKAPLRIMATDNLEEGMWQEVPAGDISVGVNPVPAGQSGDVFVAFGEGDRKFFRIEVSEP